MGPVRSFCWTVPCLDLAHFPLLLFPFAWVLGSPCSYSACSTPLVPAVHVVTVTLACVTWLCLQRAEPTRKAQSSEIGPAQQGRMFCSLGLGSALPALLTALLLQKVVQGA